MDAVDAVDRARRLEARLGDRVVRPWLVAAASVASVAYVAAVDPNSPGHYPTCPFLAITGFYCPGCGSLRAVHALAHGHLAHALGSNPLTVAAVPLLLAAWLGWLRRSRTGRGRSWAAPGWAVWALLGVVVAFWCLRNVPGLTWLGP